nr:hypothetical protein [uncultured Pedobacter sp.]
MDWSPVNLFALPFVNRRTSGIRRSGAENFIKHCRSHGLDGALRIYRGRMNKDSEVLILWLLSHQGESDSRRNLSVTNGIAYKQA